MPICVTGQYYIEGVAPNSLVEFNVDLLKSKADSLYAEGDYESAVEFYSNLKENWHSNLSAANPTKEQIQNYFFSEVIYLKTRFRLGYRKESYTSLKNLEQLINQSLGPDHLFFGMYYHELGLMTFQHLGDAQQSYEQTYKAMIVREQQLPKYKKDLGWSYNNLAIITRRLFGNDSSLVYQFKALKSRKAIVPPDPAMLLVSYSNISQEYLITGDYALEKEYLLKAQEAGKNLDPDHPYNLMVMTNLAKVFYKESDFRNALRLSKKALSLRRKNNIGEGVVKLRDNYQTIANNYLNLGYSDSSAMYLDTIISQVHKYDNNYAITLLYVALAKTKDNHDEANKILKEAIGLCDVDSECNEIWIADIYHEISKNYIRKSDPYQAIVFALKAKEIYDRLPNGNRPNHLSLYRTLSDISYKLNKKDVAVDYLESSILLQESDSLISSYWSIDAQMSLAKLYSELGKYEKADQTFSNLFEVIENNPNVAQGINRDAYRYQSLHFDNKGDLKASIEAAERSRSFRTNLDSDNVLNALSAMRLFRAYNAIGNETDAKVEFVEACGLLGVEAWLDRDHVKPNLPPYKLVSSIEQIIELYRFSGDYFFEHVDAQLELVETIISMLDDCRNNYFLHSAEQELHDIESKFYDLVLDQLYKKYKEVPNERILEVVLITMEKSRSIGMSRVSQRQKLSQENKVPHHIIAEENRVAFQSEKIFKAYSNAQASSNDSLLLEMTAQLEKLDQEKDALLQLLRTDYPQYFEDRYNHNVIKLDKIQRVSRSQKVGFMNYYISADHVYNLSVFDGDIVFGRIKLNKIQNQIADLKEILSTAYANVNEREYGSTIKTFVRLASEVYKALIGEELKDKLPEEVVIIPDGELLNLPFEVLLTNNMSDDTNFKSLPYLIREKTISYNGSLTQYLSSDEDTIGQNYHGYAPVYVKGDTDQSPTKLLPLKSNIEEIESCASLFIGKKFVGDQASVDNFKSNLGDINILHLATHTYINDRVPLDSYLSFSNSERDVENKLYAHEIVEMDINADLVVLSACETNVGEQIDGEGIRGIARSFFTAACRNLLITNWLVDDNSSNKIVYNFLKGIKEGVNPASSLRASKLGFIASCSNVHAHPSYWAPYTYYGSPVQNKQEANFSNNFIYVLGFLALLAMILGLRLSKR